MENFSVGDKVRVKALKKPVSYKEPFYGKIAVITKVIPRTDIIKLDIDNGEWQWRFFEVEPIDSTV